MIHAQKSRSNYRISKDWNAAFTNGGKNMFNGNKCVILSIKPKEIDWLLKVVAKNNLRIDYLELFDDAKKNNKELHRIYIDDESFGGIVSTIICYHEITINKNMKTFDDVNDLNRFVKENEGI